MDAKNQKIKTLTRPVQGVMEFETSFNCRFGHLSDRQWLHSDQYYAVCTTIRQLYAVLTQIGTSWRTEEYVTREITE